MHPKTPPNSRSLESWESVIFSWNSFFWFKESTFPNHPWDLDIYRYIYHTNQPILRTHTIHGWLGVTTLSSPNLCVWVFVGLRCRLQIRFDSDTVVYWSRMLASSKPTGSGSISNHIMSSDIFCGHLGVTFKII